MATKKQVYAAADEVHRTGERVSQKRVIDALWRRGLTGSPKKVGPMLIEWIGANDYDARLETATFPARLKDLHVAFVERAWAEALIEASLRYEDKEKMVAARERAARQLLDEALAATEVAVRETGLVKARQAELEAEARALKAENERMRTRLDRIRAEEFWDRVMREVADLMPVGGTLAMDEVLAGLKQSIHRGARLHKEPLDEATLRKKMGVRAWHRKFFEECPDGTLIRKAG